MLCTQSSRPGHENPLHSPEKVVLETGTTGTLQTVREKKGDQQPKEWCKMGWTISKGAWTSCWRSRQLGTRCINSSHDTDIKSFYSDMHGAEHSWFSPFNASHTRKKEWLHFMIECITLFSHVHCSSSLFLSPPKK